MPPKLGDIPPEKPPGAKLVPVGVLNGGGAKDIFEPTLELPKRFELLD